MARTKSENAARARKWRAENPEAARAHVARWRSKNQKRYNNYQQQWRTENAVSYYRQWNADHPEARAEIVSRNQLKHPNRRREYDARPESKHRRRVRRLKAYGLTVEDFDRMLKTQNACCDLCGKPFQTLPYRKTPSVDHCHKTGKVRALLCHGCNTMLGLANDSIERLEQAIQYLKRHEASNGLHS